MLARCVSRLTWPVVIALFVTAGCSRGPNADYWAVQKVDGKDVSRRVMSVGVKQGRIVGGDDGCNGWSYKSDASNMIESDLMACPQDQAEVAYRRTIMVNRVLPPISGNSLTLRAGDHVMRLRRAAPPNRADLLKREYPPSKGPPPRPHYLPSPATG